MDIVLRGHRAYAAAYLDDIHWCRWDDHVFHLRQVLAELREAGLTANPKKCHLGLTEAQYLGYSIEREIGIGLETTGKKGTGNPHIPTAKWCIVTENRTTLHTYWHFGTNVSGKEAGHLNHS